MSVLGLALVLVAAFCHATWNFFVKRVNGGPELIWLFSVVSLVLYLPLAAGVLLIERPEIGPWQLAFIAGSAMLHLCYFLLLQLGYRQGDLSLVYPTARATGPLLSTALAVLVLGESITVQMLAGAAIIVLGVLMLTGGIRPGARKVSASLAFGLGTGVLIGGYTAWDAYAVSVLVVSPLLLDYSTSIGRAVLLAPVAWRRWETVKAQWSEHRGAVILIGVFSPLAYILVLYALTFTPVVYVAPTREISVLLSVLAGTLLLGEGRLAQRLFWAAIILGGMVVLVSA